MKSDCSSCCRPCIIDASGKCRIAKVRIGIDCSFRDAWQLITQCNFDNPLSNFCDPSLEAKYKTWHKAGEPIPQDYQI